MPNPIPYNTGLTEEQLNEAFNNALNVLPEHTENTDIHVSADEKAAWDAKADPDTIYTKEEVDNLINALTSRIEALEAASTPTEEV